MKLKALFFATGISAFLLACFPGDKGSEANSPISTDTGAIGADAPDTAAISANGSSSGATSGSKQDSTKSEGNR